jgi:peptide chain release factor 2
MTSTDLHHRYAQLAEALDLDHKRIRLAEIETRTQATDLWDNQEEAVSLLAEQTELKKIIDQAEAIAEYLLIGDELSEADLATLDKEITALERQLLLSDKHDPASAILTVHAGTGGVDAQDWAEILMRMYLRFVEKGGVEEPSERPLAIDRTGWKASIIELNKGEEAGIKKVVIEIQGRYAYGLLKGEQGVHRLVRLSPFNAKNLRQTSFALVEVLPEIDQATTIQIDEKDLRIDVFRAGGHGGQGVNTTDSAVRITHLPSGIVVSVQNERSQHQNKATALTILKSRLQMLQEVKNSEERAMVRGEVKEGSWGNQIRSYVLQPYQMVKDHRTEWETSSVQSVLDGDLKGAIEAYLSQNASADK